VWGSLVESVRILFGDSVREGTGVGGVLEAWRVAVGAGGRREQKGVRERGWRLWEEELGKGSPLGKRADER
jgi:hypothetical protein